VLEIRYYVAASGEGLFAEWFAELDPAASAKIVRALARIEQGNLSNVKSVGEVCWNIGSILVLVIGFISDGMARRSSSC
jgi:hypothetical protein